MPGTAWCPGCGGQVAIGAPMCPHCRRAITWNTGSPAGSPTQEGDLTLIGCAGVIVLGLALIGLFVVWGWLSDGESSPSNAPPSNQPSNAATS